MAKVGAPNNNKNAEKWDLESAESFMRLCLSKVNDKEDYIVSGKKVKGNKYHFIGEIASDLDQYSDLPLYLSDKFDEVKHIFKVIKSKLEANCFSDSKKGIIREATALMNLKSNYGWTDRVDQTTKGEKINPTIELTKEQIDKALEAY